ncbi:putative pyridoxal-dependent aspartate 1-decarboxylase [soil metagenome]
MHGNSPQTLASLFSEPGPEVELALRTCIEAHLSRDVVGAVAPVGSEAFASASIPELGVDVVTYLAFLARDVLPHSVKTDHPRFIGHMTSALPAFVHPINRLMTLLNQNVVKIETSNAFTFLERQALAMLHRLVFQRDDAFYADHAQASGSTLWIMVSGGTLANLAALWCARNARLPGVNELGLVDGVRRAGYERAVVISSRLAHYSIGKAIDVLGLGAANHLVVPVDINGQIRLPALRDVLARCRDEHTAVIATIGVAGATETGQVDPLPEMAALCAEFGCHFHVDAAWGGPVLLSHEHCHRLAGIELADSVTLDGHKQLYLPMGLGCVVFRDPKLADQIEKSASYIIRAGSMDLGRRTLEGSRPAMALQLHAGLHVMGRSAYGEAIDGGIARASAMAELIRQSSSFELLHEPVLNIVAYRYAPVGIQATQERWNELNTRLQERQSHAGNGFVSRTTLFHTGHGEGIPIVALRSVLASPRTTVDDIASVLAEQLALGDALCRELGFG